MSNMAAKVTRIALIQMTVGKNKVENVKHACSLIKMAASSGAKLVALPECFNSPYGTQYFKEYAEAIPGPSTDELSKIAKECKIHLVGGSIPEVVDDKFYNTCTVYDNAGNLISKFRKMHLFDIDIPGKITFKESEVLQPGNEILMFTMDDLKVGIGICYDLRFPELANIYRQKGCNLLIYPGAFNMTTGPKHWKLLQQGRALDNQLFVASASPARDETASYIAWGHSMLIDPWGEEVASAKDGEEIVTADIDLNLVDEVRQNIPTSHQKRCDVYNSASLK